MHSFLHEAFLYEFHLYDLLLDYDPLRNVVLVDQSEDLVLLCQMGFHHVLDEDYIEDNSGQEDANNNKDDVTLPLL